MVIKSKPLFSSLHYFLLFSLTIFIMWFSKFIGEPWIGYVTATAFLIFVIVNLFLRSSKIKIDDNKLYFKKKIYLIPEDLKKHEVINEKFRIRSVTFRYQILVLYFKDQEVLVISSRSFSNYTIIKETILKIIGNS